MFHQEKCKRVISLVRRVWGPTAVRDTTVKVVIKIQESLTL